MSEKQRNKGASNSRELDKIGIVSIANVAVDVLKQIDTRKRNCNLFLIYIFRYNNKTNKVSQSLVISTYTHEKKSFQTKRNCVSFYKFSSYVQRNSYFYNKLNYLV